MSDTAVSDHPAPADSGADVLYVRAGPRAPYVLRWSRERPLTIGRLPENALALVDDDQVSRRHAEIRCLDGQAVLHDPGSANGTHVNGRLVQAPTPLAPGDRISIGSAEIVYNPSPAPPSGQAWLREVGLPHGAERAPLAIRLSADGPTVLGRAPEQGVALPDETLADQQANIQPLFGDYVVTDLASAGTRLNGEPLVGPARLADGDELALGGLRLRFELQPARDAAARPRSEPGELSEVASALGRVVPFDRLAPDLLEGVAQRCEWVDVSAGSYLGSAARARAQPALYVLVAGEGQLVGELSDRTEQPYVVATLEPGDLIGARAVCDDAPLPRPVRASTTLRLLRLPADAGRELAESDPDLRTLLLEDVPRQALRRQLARGLLGRLLPPSTIEALLSRLEPLTFAPGERLATRGEPAERFFLLVGGCARVLSAGDGRPDALSRLGAEESFGDAIAAPGGVYSHTVVAETPVEAYALSRAAYAAVLADDPEVQRRLAAGLDLRPPSVLLQDVAPFNSLPPQLVGQTAAAMRLKTFRAGEIIVEQDDPASGFYIIRSGSVAVSFRTSSGDERPIATLGPSQHFGEAALLTGEGRNATVRAAEDCQLWALYKDDFQNALAVGRAFALGTYFSQALTMRSRPRRLPGVEVARQAEGGEEAYVLRSADGQSYLRLSERGIFVWNQLDGDHTINDICVAYFARYNTFGLDAIASTVAQLQGLNFIHVPPTDLEKLLPDPRSAWWERALSGALRLLTWRTVFPRADAWFTALYRGGGWLLYTPPALALLALVTVAGVGAFGYLGLVVLAGGVPGREEFDGTALLLIPIGLLLITVLHEVGHALTCKHFGRQVNGAGIGIAYLFPYAFVGTSDIWMVGKGPRIAVSAAGPLVNLFTGSLCALGALVVPDVTLRSALFILAILSYLLVIGNLHPFMELDGYYVLVDWLEMPSLRKRAMRFLRSGLWRCLRTSRFDREERVLAVFGAAVFLFTIGMGLSLVVFARDLATGILSPMLPPAVGDAVGWALAALVFLVFILPFVFELELLTPQPLATDDRRD